MGLLSSTTPGHIGSQSHLRVSIGGAESNFAIAMSRLGNEVSWLGRVGADEFGRLITRELHAEQVRVPLSPDGSGAATGLMLKSIPVPGRQDVTYYRTRSAGSRLCPEDMEETQVAELISSADVLHVTGITLAISESARDAAFRAVEIARANGTLVAVDINHRHRIWSAEHARPVYRRFVSKADVVFAGLEEAAMVVKGVSRDELEVTDLLQKLQELTTLPIIKEGDQGSWGLVDQRLYHQAAFKVRVVDPVGAGDGFAAGFLHAYAEGASVVQSLRMGSRVGAFACLSPGDWEGYPTPSELAMLDSTPQVIR